MRVAVECYAERKADERPVRFRLEGHDYTFISEVHGPDQLAIAPGN